MEESSVNVEQLAANKFLYKGLNTNAFPIYFRQGGISPKHSNYPWITRSLSKAVENSGGFSDMGPQFTLAVVPFDVVNSRGNLFGFKADSYKDDFHGDEKITWQDTSKIFTSKRGMGKIREAYEEVNPEMSWEEFNKKIEVVESKEDFFKKIKALGEASLAT